MKKRSKCWNESLLKASHQKMHREHLLLTLCILNQFLLLSRLELNYEDYVKLDMMFLRPEELTDLKGDPSKLMKATGWKPTYTFETMLDEMISYWLKELNRVF